MDRQTTNGQNIISFGAHRRARAFSALAQVEGYWHGLRNGAAIPSRAQIDPRGIEDALEYAFILEIVAPGVARFRLAGAHLGDLMGLEVRGMPVTAMFTAEARARMSATIAAVCEGPAIAELELEAERGIGRPTLRARMLLAPLTDDFGTVNRIFGCLQSEGRIGRQPRRLKITESRTRPVGQDRPAAPVRTGALAEAPTPVTAAIPAPKPKGPDNRPALRVVSSLD